MNAAADRTTNLATALYLAEELGIPVFPCRRADEWIEVHGQRKLRKAKSPLTRRGFADATRNVEQITEWWNEYPDALIGVPTGAASGLFVIDVDPRGAEWYAANASRLEAKRVHKTHRGHHLLYRACGLGCSTGTLADGVDTRGEGGYVVWWPAEGMPTVGDLEDVGDLPEWVRAALQSAPAAKRERAPSDGGIGADRSRDLLRRVARDVRDGLADYEILQRHRAHPHAADQSDPQRAVQRCIDLARAERAQRHDADRDDVVEWPDPVDFLREMSAPPFTPDLVPDVLGEYPFAYSRQTGIDPGLCITAAITAAAAALSDDFAVVADSGSAWMQPPRVWVLAVAPSGAGKSPAQRAMLAPLHDVQRELVAHYQRQCEALGEDEPKPPRPRVVLSDTTVEALSEALRDNPRGLLVANDEFEGFLGSLDQYRRGAASRDRGEWLRAFDGGPHTVERVQRGSVYVPNFGVSLLTATTPTALAKVARMLPEDGLLQRFLVCIARRQQDGEPVHDLEVKREAFADLLRKLYAATPRLHRGKVPMMQLARDAFTEWRRRIRVQQEALDGLDPALGAHLAKFPTFALRLAAVFHAVQAIAREDHDDPAEWPLLPETLDLAFRFLDRCRQHAVCLYLTQRGGSEAFDLAREVARAVVALGTDQIERRDLLRHSWAFRKADPQQQAVALDLLVDLGWLRPTASGYRKSEPTRFAVNPGIAPKFAQLAERERERRSAVREAIREAAHASR
jgi:hypothetical protein